MYHFTVSKHLYIWKYESQIYLPLKYNCLLRYYRKATRATLILVPLLGIQYLLFPIRPSPGSNLEELYHIVVALFVSLQVSWQNYLILNDPVKYFNHVDLLVCLTSILPGINNTGAKSKAHQAARKLLLFRPTFYLFFAHMIYFQIVKSSD